MQVVHIHEISKTNKYKEFASQASAPVNMEINKRKLVTERERKKNVC